MAGVLDNVLVRPSPRVLSRRSVILLTAVAIFIAGFLVVSSRLAESCDDGGLCGLSRLQHKPSNLGDDNRLHHHPDATGTASRDAASRDAASHCAASRDAASHCAAFPDTSKVLLVMKTGASEAYDKMPNQILTNLRCLPEFLVFSDKAQTVAGYTILDSLDTVLPEVKLKNKDFDLYFRQLKCPTDQASCNKDHNAGKEAWSLDKYKNVHMAEKAYAMRPGYDWYLFVDADTYVVWPTLMPWLDMLDPSETHYIGSVAYVANFPFGHGGSGYLVSQATMSKLFKGRTGVANRWDERATHECCGDYVFSLALKTETSVGVENAWPTINGEKPHSLPYARDQWCQPLVTMHHASAEEVSEIYAFEKERNFSHPMRIKDMYHRFVKDQLQATRDDWDNLSDSVLYLNSSAANYTEWELRGAKKEGLSALELAAHRSFDDCRRACQSVDECFQYRFRNGICAISHGIKHGKPAKPEQEERQRYRSGWNLKRIQAWVEAHDDCGKVQYPLRKGWLSRMSRGP